MTARDLVGVLAGPIALLIGCTVVARAESAITTTSLSGGYASYTPERGASPEVGGRTGRIVPPANLELLGTTWNNLVDDDGVESDDHPEAAYVHTLDAPMVEMPLEMAYGAGQVFLGCEAKAYRRLTGLEDEPYVWPGDAVGAQGELGGPQIHSINFPEMVVLGLDPYDEGDRLRYAAHKWHYTGWRPWTCRP